MELHGQYQAPLSIGIARECNTLLGLLVETSLEVRTIKTIDGTGGKVSIADLLAYQIGWGNLVVTWYNAGLKNEMPQMPGEGFTKWDYIGLAQHFYKKYQYDSYREQEQEFFTLVEKIIAIVEAEYETKNLGKEGIWDWCTLASGKRWPLSKWITVNTLAPYKRAITLVKKATK